MKNTVFTSVLISLLLVGCSKEAVRRPKYEGIVGKAVSIVDETYYAILDKDELIKDEEPVIITTYNFDVKGNTVKKITEWNSSAKQLSAHEDYTYDEDNILTLKKTTYKGSKESSKLIQKLIEKKGSSLLYKKYWEDNLGDTILVKENMKSKQVDIVESFMNGSSITQSLDRRGHLIEKKNFYPDKSVKEQLECQYSNSLLFSSVEQTGGENPQINTASYKYSQRDKMGNWRVMHIYKNDELSYAVNRSITYR